MAVHVLKAIPGVLVIKKTRVRCVSARNLPGLQVGGVKMGCENSEEHEFIYIYKAILVYDACYV